MDSTRPQSTRTAPVPAHGLIAPRPAPAAAHGIWAWLRDNLFGSLPSALATVLLAACLIWLLPPAVDWAWSSAVFRADLDACRAAQGACWGVVHEKFRIIVFGRYPQDALWRAALASALLLGLLLLSALRSCWRPWLLLPWSLLPPVYFVLMHGGVAGLSLVPTERWGGLPLTLLLASVSMALAFPLGVLLALGRRSSLPALRALCGAYVELVRGVPLISVLFMASYVLPLLLPAGVSLDVLLRVLLAIALFAAAYLAEVLRGGLQALPAGQQEAALSLGLSYWQMQGRVLLPQALTLVLPGLVNNFISTFKDTSLVTIVSLYELTGGLGLALDSDPDWQAYKTEGYLFIALLYFVFCFGLSRYSRRLERMLAHARPA